MTDKPSNRYHPKGKHGTKPERRVPWDRIRLRYVTQVNLSLREVATEFKVHHWHVQRRAKAEGWALARRDFLREVLDEARTQIASELAGKARAGLLETLDQLGSTRREVLKAYLAEIAAPNDMRPMDQTIVKQSKDAEGNVTTTTVRRGRAPLNSKLAETAIKLEAEILLEAAGMGRSAGRASAGPGAPEGDEEVVIE